MVLMIFGQNFHLTGAFHTQSPLMREVSSFKVSFLAIGDKVERNTHALTLTRADFHYSLLIARLFGLFNSDGKEKIATCYKDCLLWICCCYWQKFFGFRMI